MGDGSRPARSPTADPVRGWRAPAIVLGVALWAQWPLLVNAHGVYWDDWTIWGQTYDEMMKSWRGNGLVWAGWIHQIMGAIGNGIWPYRLATGAAWCVIAWSVASLGRTTGLLDARRAVIAGALTAAVPLFPARVCLAIFHYSLMPALLAAASLLLASPQRCRRPAVRAGVATLTFAACLFPSVPAVAPIAWWAACQSAVPRRRGTSWARTVAGWVRAAPEMPLAAVAAVLVSRLLLRPAEGGLWAEQGYHALSVGGAIRALALVPPALQVVGEQIGRAVGSLNVLWLLAAAFATARAAPAAPRPDAAARATTGASLRIASVGLALLVLGLLPYLVAAKLPTLDGWRTRHALLAAPGAALLLVGVAGCVGLRGRPAAFAALLAVACCAQTSAAQQVEHLRTWFRMEAVTAALRDAPLVRAASVVSFRDENPDRVEAWRPYECAGLLRVATGEETRYGATDLAPRQPVTVTEEQRRFGAWNCSGFRSGEATVEVVVRRSWEAPSRGDLLHAVWRRTLAPDAFERDLAVRPGIDVRPLE